MDNTAAPTPEELLEKQNKTRMIIVSVTVAIALVIALIPLVIALRTGGQEQAPSTVAGAGSSAGTAAPGGGGDTSEESQSTRGHEQGAPVEDTRIQVDSRVRCPSPRGQSNLVAPGAELRDVSLPCLTEGNAPATTNLAAQFAGKPTVVNVWAWWCGPCRGELPAIQQLKEQNPQWNVVGVHLDAKAQAGADFLKELEVTNLASYQDSNHAFDAATAIPKVVPITLVYRPDGTRAAMFAKVFHSAEELRADVDKALAG